MSRASEGSAKALLRITIVTEPCTDLKAFSGTRCASPLVANAAEGSDLAQRLTRRLQALHHKDLEYILTTKLFSSH